MTDRIRENAMCIPWWLVIAFVFVGMCWQAQRAKWFYEHGPGRARILRNAKTLSQYIGD